MKQISINWVHTYKQDNREQAIKALALAKEQEKNKAKNPQKIVKKMNRDAKTIKCSLRPDIEIVKGYIRDSIRPFDGSGYVFKSAIKELRDEGIKILYIKEKCHYIKC